MSLSKFNSVCWVHICSRYVIYFVNYITNPHVAEGFCEVAKSEVCLHSLVRSGQSYMQSLG